MQMLLLTGCSVDLDRGVVRTDGGEERALSTLEVALMRYLADRPRTDVGRDELVREVWGGAGAPRVVDFTVRRLRTKLGEPTPPRHVVTAHGHGYRYVPLAGSVVRAAPPDELVVPLLTGELYLAQRRFVRDGRSFEVSRNEALLLELLVADLGRPVPRQKLIERVWGRGRHEHTLDATIARLRAKLERDPASPTVLLTARKQGPRLVGAAGITRGNLPAASASFVERPERMAALEALARHRLVMLLGTAGIGKTRLAREVGAAWLVSDRAAEVWFCDLLRVGSVSGMIARVSTTIGGESTTDPEQVGRMMAARPPGTLFVLDNLEHLVDNADVIGRWVAAARDARFLATSRIPLGLPCEHLLPLEPLDVRCAVQLFRERSPDAVLDAASVQALVERLDGLPLAIELAASLTERMSAETILARLGARLDLLIWPPEGAASQHSTLRGAIDWSWHLLDAEQQEVLAATAVFCAPFDAGAAAAVMGRDVKDVLDALVFRSLLRRVEGSWALLPSIRDYARERLALAGALRDRTERHAQHLAELTEPLADDLGGRWGTEAMVRLNDLHDDLIAALEGTEQPELRGRLALVLSTRGFQDQSPALVHEALTRALARGVSSAQEPQLWLALARCSWNQGLTTRAEQEIARAEGARPDAALRIAVATARSRNAIVRREPALAETHLEAARAELSERPPSEARLRGMAEVAALRAQALNMLQRIDGWEQAIREAQHLAEELGDVFLLGGALRESARFHLKMNDLERVGPILDRVVAIAANSRRPREELVARLTKVILEQDRGAFRAASEELKVYEALADVAGVSPDYGSTVRCAIALERGDVDAALAGLPERALAGVLESWIRTTRAAALRYFGRAEEAIDQLLPLSEPPTQVHLSLAGACAEAGRHAEAQRWLSRARQESDPRVWGDLREIALTEALVALEAARGTEGWEEAQAAARIVLDAGVWVLCDDGSLQERPSDVAVSRMLLERALAWEIRG